MTSDSLRRRRLAGAFLFGWVFFNYPIFSLFNLPMSWAGVPLQFAYVFIVWAALIVLISLAAHRKPPAAGTEG